jgi:hypothetical protein
MRIKGKNGEIDHSTLPAFAHKTQIKKIYSDVELEEVKQTDAFETVEEDRDVIVETYDPSGKRIKQKISAEIVEKQDGFKIENGEVVPNITRQPVYQTKKIQVKKLKKNIYFNEETGLFYRKQGESEVKRVNGRVIQQIETGEEVENQRDLGAMISILTVAIQQLKTEIDELKKGK